jgi:hypothetical protein
MCAEFDREWKAGQRLDYLWDQLAANAGPRKQRLFWVAKCRRVWAWFDERSRRAVEVAELYADGNATREELLAALRSVDPRVIASAACAGDEDMADGWSESIGNPPPPPAVWADGGTWAGAQRRESLALLYEIMGNPFRSTEVKPVWLTWNNGTVSKLARAIYTDRAFDRLPLLADALEDAGCADATILAHCRSGGEHVRGCWVIDLLLGKE